jgi:hypothetical protein
VRLPQILLACDAVEGREEDDPMTPHGEYARHSAYSDPGRYASLLEAVPERVLCHERAPFELVDSVAFSTGVLKLAYRPAAS